MTYTFIDNGGIEDVSQKRNAKPKRPWSSGKIVEKGLYRSLKTFDGCFNPRKMRGSDNWSTHSWAIAIDLDAPWNRFGQTSFQMSEEVAQCFEEEGFIWGGRWYHRPDAMHFQYCALR